MKSLFSFAFIASFFLISCSNSPTAPNNDPIPVYDSFSIESINVGELRNVNVWTPPQYNNSNDSFPVLYMPDGAINEDFPHIAHTIATLIETGNIPPVILVGIPNTQRRRDLSGFTEVEEDKKIAPEIGGSEKFRAFIAEELFPEVNKRYRTTQEKGIIGESLAGLFIVETLLSKPEMFDFYIAMDPSLWWNNHYLIRTLENFYPNFTEKKVKFWFAGSGAEDISVFTNELERKLNANAPESLIWQYSDEPMEQHHTIYRATKEKALKWVLGSTN